MTGSDLSRIAPPLRAPTLSLRRCGPAEVSVAGLTAGGAAVAAFTALVLLAAALVAATEDIGTQAALAGYLDRAEGRMLGSWLTGPRPSCAPAKPDSSNKCR